MPRSNLKSLHGRELYLDDQGYLVAKGFKAGLEGRQVEHGSAARAVHFDDFIRSSQALSTTAVDGWRSTKGSDAQCVDWTITPAVGGTIVGTIGDTTASMAVSGVQLDSGLNWKANQGGLVLEARVKLSAITDISVFVGFTDQVSALEMPIHSAASANTITTNATDGLGFFFDTSMDDDKWWIAGVANNTSATHQNTTYAPVADTYETLRVEVGSDGSAYFFRNGLVVGTKMTGAVTATVALTPVIAGFNRTTSGTPTITADYISVAGDRG